MFSSRPKILGFLFVGENYSTRTDIINYYLFLNSTLLKPFNKRYEYGAAQK